MIKVKLTNDEVINLYKVLNHLPETKGNIKFKYGVIRNLKNLKGIIESLEEAKKPSTEMEAYRKGIVELASKHCETDENGLVLYKDDSFKERVASGYMGVPKPKTSKSKVALEKDILKHQETNKELLDAETKKAEEFNALLKEEVEIDVYAIDINDIQSIGDVSYNQMLSLEVLINE